MSLSFMTSSLVQDANEMGDLGDHATDGRRVLERRVTPDLIELKTDQGAPLGGGAQVRIRR